VPTLTAIDPQFRTPANGVGFAIPVNRVKFIAPQLIKNGRVVQTGRAALGVQVATVDAVVAQQNQLPVDHGAIITSVTQGGSAAQAGLKAGDIIVQVDNTPIVDTSSLSDVLISKSPGDTVRVTVYRGNQQLTVSVKLGELPPQ
jgi:S1-C subfamily serine protease